jgi:two-component system sensor histidine kinase KdpD
VPRGVLRIYLGAAPGVGKTCAMLDEAQRRLERGTDVVVGVADTKGRIRTEARLRGLEVLPTRVSVVGGRRVDDLDVAAVLARSPRVVLVDDLEHRGAPDSGHDRRWQAVVEILDAGIDVIGTLNIQHLESLQDVVSSITGTVEPDTVPDAFVRSADQIELVDMSPEALRRRLAHGNVRPAEELDASALSLFRPERLAALRELALLWVADRTDEVLRHVDPALGAGWEVRERVVVAVAGGESDDRLIRRAARLAGRLRGDVLVVHVVEADRRGPDGARGHARLLATEVGGTYHEVVGNDVAEAIVRFAETEGATQLVVGAPARRRPGRPGDGSVVGRVLRLVRSADVHVVVVDAADVPVVHRRHRVLAPLSPRRRAFGWLALVVGSPVLAAVLLPLRGSLELSTVLLAFLTHAVVVAAIGGVVVGLAAAVVGFAMATFGFVEPYGTWTIHASEDLVALLLFLVVTGVVAALVDVAARRLDETRVARGHAEVLARSTAELAAAGDPVPQILEHVRTAFGFDSVRIADAPQGLRRIDPGEPGATVLPLRGAVAGRVLELRGPPPSAADLEVLRTITDQLAVAIDARHLQRQADDAAELAGIDALRTALLQAVSHDLRTPLAAIKAYVTGLQATDVVWSEEQLAEAHAAIDAETDRLDRLVANLLDAGRLQAGTLAVACRPTAVADVVRPALAGHDEDRIVVDVEEHTPLVHTDPVLLERAVGNLVGNALRHSPADQPVLLEARQVLDRVHLRIADHGPGIPPEDRSRVFQPFQRLDDRSVHGLGLGLAITRGFVHAVGGTLELDDTPGGGLTVLVTVPVALGATASPEGVGG